MMLEVAAAIGAGRITLDSIHDDTDFVYGYCEGGSGKIVINPALPVVEVAIHECLHRLRWAWSEQTVQARTTRLMRQLSNAEIDRLYALILAGQPTRRRRPQTQEDS